ncbi:Pectinesterase inhibitor domain - like 10 [Theobroma cacao]|nr:Pectinesterase inhibitor domain - like 10 [Theobroma cacao]
MKRTGLGKNISTAKDDDLIRETCTQYTEFPDICVSTLEAYPRSKAATNFTSLCRAAMEVTETQANKTLSFVSQFYDNETDFRTKSGIRSCMHNYGDSVTIINITGLLSFDRKNYRDAYDSIGYTREGAAECNDTGVPMFFDRNNEVIMFTTIVLDLLNNLITN